MAAFFKRTFSNILVVILAIALPTSQGFSVASYATRVKDTKASAGGKATSAVIPPPNALSRNVTLTTYMQLPVEQYVMIPMPLGSSLTRTNDGDGGADYTSSKSSAGNTEFELVVPTITFFNLSLQPVVRASVQTRENRVVISATKCMLRGSSFIEKVQLNDRFDFCVKTTLTWKDSVSQMNSAQGNDKHGYLNDVVDYTSMDCSITAETHIEVDVDVPRPFSSIPKVILQRTANSAMKLSIKYIQGNFVDNLAKDYAKWATDLQYRNYRASLSEKKDVKEVVY